MKQVRLSDLIISKYHSTFKDKRYTHKIFTSGRAGTKSSRGGLKAIHKIISDNDAAVVFIRKTHNKLRKTVFKECLRAIDRLKLDKNDFKITVSPMEIRYKKNGNPIIFTGNDSIDDTKGIIDAEKPIKLVIVDEVTEFFNKGEGEDELQNIEATFIRGNDDEFCMEYYFNPPRNPKAPIMQWVEKMCKRKDCIRIHTDYRDVPPEWLGKKLIASAEELKRLDIKMYNWLWLGLCTGIDELIYYMFNEDSMVQEPTKEQFSHMKFLVAGGDYGQMNSTTFEIFGLDFVDKCLRGIDEYYYSGRDEGKQKSPSQYAQDFKKLKEKVEKETGKKLLVLFLDPSAKGLAEEIKRICPEVSIPNADNTVALGISRVQKLMSYMRLFLSPKQKHLITERYMYEYDKDKLDKGKEEPIKQNDHCSDAERYTVMGVWKYIRQILPNLIGEKD